MGKVRLEKFISEYSQKNKNRNSYPVYSVTNSNGFCTEYFTKDVSSEDKSGYKLVPFGYFAYNPSRINVGSIDCQMKEKNVIVSPLYTVFKVENGLNIEYLRYFFKSNYCKHLIQSKVSGSVRFNLKFDTLKSFEINEISNSEQQKAVGLFSSIENLIKIEEKELSFLNELIKSRFNELFGDSKSLVKIGDVLSTTSGGTPSKGKSEYYLNGDIPWLCSGEVNAGIITEVKNRITELGLKNSSAKWIPKNSVVVAMYGATAGKVGLLKIKTTTNQAVCSILPSPRFIPEFLYYAVGSKAEELVSKAWGGAQPNISQGIIKNTFIPNPTIDEQKEFASFVTLVDKLKFSLLMPPKIAIVSIIFRLIVKAFACFSDF